jgi:hypothetical protein
MVSFDIGKFTIVYHITRKENMPSIYERGLLPGGSAACESALAVTGCNPGAELYVYFWTNPRFAFNVASYYAFCLNKKLSDYRELTILLPYNWPLEIDFESDKIAGYIPAIRTNKPVGSRYITGVSVPRCISAGERIGWIKESTNTLYSPSGHLAGVTRRKAGGPC